MRRIPTAAVLVVVGALLAPASRAEAQEGAEPFEFSLFSPLQVRGVDAEIQVLRLSLLYGENVSVRGLDVGLVARGIPGGESKGLQWALVGYTEGDFVGWQDGWLAGWVDGNFTGLQGPAAVNHVGSGEVVQIGLVNTVDDASGFQLGIVNFAENFYGLQVGLLNIIESKTS